MTAHMLRAGTRLSDDHIEARLLVRFDHLALVNVHQFREVAGGDAVPRRADAARGAECAAPPGLGSAL